MEQKKTKVGTEKIKKLEDVMSLMEKRMSENFDQMFKSSLSDEIFSLRSFIEGERKRFMLL